MYSLNQKDMDEVQMELSQVNSESQIKINFKKVVVVKSKEQKRIGQDKNQRFSKRMYSGSPQSR